MFVSVYSQKKLVLALGSMLAVFCSAALHAQTPNYQSNITAASNWLASSAVTLSDGAMVDGANSTRVNPYFANLGAIGWTKDPNHYNQVKNWMEWYWGHVSWPMTINGVQMYGAIN